MRLIRTVGTVEIGYNHISTYTTTIQSPEENKVAVMIGHALFDRDKGVGRGEDGLETKTVPPHHDAYHALLVGNEQDHRDAVLEEQKPIQNTEHRTSRKGTLGGADGFQARCTYQVPGIR